MCLYPKLIKNRRYVANKKNRGVIPPLPIGIDGKPDERVMMVPVGCQKCMECRKKKRREWQVRLTEEVKHNKNGIFVTLTFSDESIKELGEGIKLDGYNRDNEIAKIGVRRFLERWRKKYKKSVRHWLVTELGHNGTENVHLHGIIWTDKDPKEIDRIWKYGYTWLSTENKGYVNYKTINYIVKYISKTDIKHKEYKPKILTSSGIGKGYVKSWNFKQNKFKKDKTNEVYINEQGYKFALPIYYRNKLYEDEEREQLWLEKLNKQIRFVDGMEIDISKNDDNYWKALDEARRKNKRLQFGDDKINWELKKYERNLRNMNYKKRVQRAYAKGRKGGN